MNKLVLVVLTLILSLSTLAATQPTNVNNINRPMYWDELNSRWYFSELIHQETASLNTGVATTTTASIDLRAAKQVQFQVVTLTGTITNAVVTLQQSLDGTTWVSSSTTVTSGGLSAILANPARFIRFIVSTQSAVASTAKVVVSAK